LWLLASDGDEADIHPHAHHAIQITFGLRGTFALSTESARLTGPVAAVASDTRHLFRGNGVAAFLFVAPESAAGIALSSDLFRDAPLARLAGPPALAAHAALQACLEHGVTDAALRALGHTIVAELSEGSGAARLDPRVLAMIAWARHHLDDRISLARAADHVHLSQSRARHLFAAQTGLPFKTYVLWLRLEHAVQCYAAGTPLTEAAHHAGFADSAHFSRTFRRTFGLPAAALRLTHDRPAHVPANTSA
jgi:AraC-like DNA-binding protein